MKESKEIMKESEIITLWEQFMETYPDLFKSNLDIWKDNLTKVENYVKQFNKLPSQHSKNKDIKTLGKWCSRQKMNYAKSKGTVFNESECKKLWEEFIMWLDNRDNEPIPKKKNKVKVIDTDSDEQLKPLQARSMTKKYTSKEKSKNKKIVVKGTPLSQFSKLGRKYAVMNSSNLHQHFKEDPSRWYEYHELMQAAEKKFRKVDQDRIAYRRVINYLENMKVRRKQYIADLGCGHARIARHFVNNEKFEFYNYDHHAIDETVTEADISAVPLEDHMVNIAILCLAMWGSNCHSYLDEVYRILEDNGTLLIVEPGSRWIDTDTAECKLHDLIESKGFRIKSTNFTTVDNFDDKFIFVDAIKC